MTSEKPLKMCMGCGRLSEWEILCQGCQNIVRNLRAKYGTKLAKISDSVLARRYADYNLSDKLSGTELDWIT